MKDISERIITNNLQVREASVIDIQRHTLPQDVWDKIDGKYTLKDTFREELISRAVRFMKDTLHVQDTSFIRGLYLVSSIGTYFYSSTTDIDVKIIVDFEKLFDIRPGLRSISIEVLTEYLVDKTRDAGYMTQPIEGSIRPLDWYIYEFAAFMDYRDRKAPRFDCIYDVVNNRWYKFTPPIEELPKTEVFNYAVGIAKELLSNLDTTVGKLHRNAIDYDYFRSYLKYIDPNSVDVKAEMEKVISDIELLMQEIGEEKENYSALRREAFDEEKMIGKFSKLYKSINFSDVNLVRKVLEHYGYWYTIMELYKLWDDSDEKVTPKFVNDLETLIKEV